VDVPVVERKDFDGRIIRERCDPGTPTILALELVQALLHPASVVDDAAHAIDGDIKSLCDIGLALASL
jgi:hypothetical protein